MIIQGDSILYIYKRKFSHGMCIYGENVQQVFWVSCRNQTCRGLMGNQLYVVIVMQILWAFKETKILLNGPDQLLCSNGNWRIKAKWNGGKNVRSDIAKVKHLINDKLLLNYTLLYNSKSITYLVYEIVNTSQTCATSTSLSTHDFVMN